ncbi:hypothetical protein B0T19DRAFT_432207 [Cercophora scortea]|uniref:Uncharacterized protein n=1 Tax=Cercophora scortea TaxID=314031 RepID=A0AAE0M728_9PEZI|nr:hypothetical protein B0T19DRAFT_432207 [Cercophora scortea]
MAESCRILPPLTQPQGMSSCQCNPLLPLQITLRCQMPESQTLLVSVTKKQAKQPRHGRQRKKTCARPSAPRILPSFSAAAGAVVVAAASSLAPSSAAALFPLEPALLPPRGLPSSFPSDCSLGVASTWLLACFARSLLSLVSRQRTSQSISGRMPVPWYGTGKAPQGKARRGR